MDLPRLGTLPSAPGNAGSLFQNSSNSSVATIRLDKVIASLNRGRVIAHFPNTEGAFSSMGYLCNYHVEDDSAKLEWGQGAVAFGDWRNEFGKIFYQIMQERSHNVVGDPGKLFGNKEEVQAAEYLIGARITDIRGNFCQEHHWWDGRPLKRFKGEGYMKIDWEVFASLGRRVVYRVQTEGYAQTRDFKRQGMLVTFQNAFADAVERFGTDVQLRRITNREAQERPTDQTFGKLALRGAKPFRQPIREKRGEVLNSVVTIRLGTGHGSGFVIGEGGYLLTNAHVVGDGKRVPVLFSNGLRVSGEVLRVSKRRDVALVKIPVEVTHILPIARGDRLSRFDEVYVVGTPALVELQSTITKGIVSAFRKDLQGNTFIQSDAAITGGNSGGPMLDKNGNVVGISVQSYSLGQNLNLFIPIDSALEALNIRVD
tara:strand:+ start:492 stop:1775 length:1284 start_codon:yes stop_codon:yes gene_type:complete